MTTVSRFAAVVIALAAVGFSTVAAAQEEPDELTRVSELESELDTLDASLATIDCTSACDALASMNRAADRICELEPGPRCTAARKRVEDARSRVRDACPECALARREQRTGDRTRNEPAGGVPTEPEATGGDVAAMDEDGGCATCTVGGGGDARHLFAGLLGALVLVWRRRR